MTLHGPMPGDPPEVDRLLNAMTGVRAYDIGANQGGYTRGLAARFDHVVACEPAYESFEVLAGLGWPNVHAMCCAVTDHDGDVTLNVQANSIKSGQLTTDSGGGGLQTHTWGAVLDTRTVPAYRLDTLVVEHGRPDFVKVDTEGHEVQVIRGGLECVAEYKPALYLEIHCREFGDEIVDLIGGFYDHIEEVKHPHYRPAHWGHMNHYWLIADSQE